MINLIPNKEKKEMVKGSRYRLLVLFLGMADAFFIITLIVILPSYFLSSVKIGLVNAKLESQKSEPIPVPQEQTLLAIKELNDKLNLIDNAEKSQFNISDKVVNAIILKKLPSIKITDIFYENDPQKALQNKPVKQISIEGTAPSREVLLLFRQALEDSPAFSQVDLPISNFVKGSDIKFYLSLIPS